MYSGAHSITPFDSVFNVQIVEILVITEYSVVVVIVQLPREHTVDLVVYSLNSNSSESKINNHKSLEQANNYFFVKVHNSSTKKNVRIIHCVDLFGAVVYILSWSCFKSVQCFFIIIIVVIYVPFYRRSFRKTLREL